MNGGSAWESPEVNENLKFYNYFMNQIQLFNSTSNGKFLQSGATPEQIRSYFQAIFRLKMSGEKFPVNLDEVWPLVYTRRNNAVRVLKTDFTEGVDYVIFTQNEQQKGSGGHNRIDYRISLACLECFVAQKVRALFDVYREVFHKAAEMSRIDLLKMVVKAEEDKLALKG